ncbi:MAG: hypothetical protein FJ209_00730 [Betaproteobacteria bacterium]|nr:hypothetical protein [Betaproteobacteria bacterium]
MLSRQVLANAWSKRFAGLNDGYWISLNSKIHVKGRHDHAIQDKFIKFEGMVSKFIDHMNGQCFGRKYVRREHEAKLTCLVGYEVGDVEGLIHCHIAAAHNGSTNRTVDDVRRISKWKWQKICKTNGSEQFVDVDGIGNIHDRIWYMTKQSEQHQRLFGEFNFSLH